MKSAVNVKACKVCGEYSKAPLCPECKREVTRATNEKLPWQLRKVVS